MSVATDNLFRAAEAWAKIKLYALVPTNEADLLMDSAIAAMGFDLALNAIAAIELVEAESAREVVVIFECGLKLTIPLTDRRTAPR